MSRAPIWESDDATVVLDDEDGDHADRENVSVRVHQHWVVVKHSGERQVIPRHRVEEVFAFR